MGYSTISQAAEVDGIVYTGTDSIVITDYKGTVSSLDLNEYFSEATEITIKDWAFASTTLTSIILPKTVVAIGESAFDTSSIRTITFAPDTKSLTLGNNIFKDCSNLIELDIPDCVTVIPGGLCYDCKSLLRLSLPDDCTSIGKAAFYNCNSLSSVSIPATCSSISSNAFDRCEELQSVIFEKTQHSDRTLVLGAQVFGGCELLTTISLPEGCTGIPANAFWSCDSLRSITLPESCMSISNNAFAYCNSLSQINSTNAQEAILPKNCSAIGCTAFQSCTSLKNIEIPVACTSIGDEAFAGCTGLNQVVFENENTAIGNKAFPTTQKAPNMVIYCINVGNVTIYADKAGISCESSVQSVIVTELPDIREYMYSTNGKLDLSGLVVKASVMSLSTETGYENKEVAIEDCIISSFDSTLAGKQTITITYGGKQDSFDVKVYYDIANITITVQPTVYTGTAVIPTFVAFNNDTEQVLIYETDYLYSCQNNINVGDQAMLTLVGIGNYKGEKTVTFSIIADEGVFRDDDKENTGNKDIDNSDNAENGTNNNSGNTSILEKTQIGKTYTIKGMKYKVTSSTSVTFMKPVSKNIKKCTIPSTVEISGRVFKVTKINKKACYGYKKLTRVTIGDNVITIGEQSFAQCTSLKKVIIGKGLKTIDKKAFYKDKKLTHMTIRSKKLNKVGKDAMKGVKLKELMLANGASKQLKNKYKKLIKKAQ